MPILRSLQEIGQEVRGAVTGASRRQTGNTWTEQSVGFQAGSFCLGCFTSIGCRSKSRGASVLVWIPRRACLTVWRLWGWPRGPSSMCPAKAPACSPRPPLTSPAWTPLPGPAQAASSVSTLPYPSSTAVCVSLSESWCCYHGALSAGRDGFLSDSVCPFSPCLLFVYVLSVLCEGELGSTYLYITLFVFFMNDFT